ncbi:PorT family protein [Bacteroides sp. 214]|uniref:porin family protein n=1 Tax=Bacteroides sp. 214 TaxID=2302935 RepID=UPI0013D103B0|nr:porin family protein [Bacteroides sp. 214]NDW12808.1 PorT family protein [Bacteroides sp. 214]
MRRIVLTLTILSLFTVVVAQEHHEKDRVTVDFGAKAGFNSSLYLVNDFKINDVTIKNIQNNYRVGWFTTLFMRINMQKHYLQPELVYQVSRSEIVFDKLGSQHPEIEPNYASIKATIHSLELPILYGYNIIKQKPYGLSVFAGPVIKLLWEQNNKISFDNFDQNGIQEELYPVNAGFVLGTGVRISHIFFDFRYEIGLMNISKSVTYEKPEGRESGNITFDRRNNILSFSLGIMF